MDPQDDAFVRTPILQIHPTRRCNLECRHCYSASGPRVSEGLDAERVCAALRDASAEGYAVAGFSGGEPLLYRDLARVLDCAHRLDMVTTVTSNGMLLTPERIAELKDRVDLLAISLDGVPESHDRMRASSRAFATMAGRLDALRASGIPFGFIFTLTLHNLHELDWVAAFALEQGAALLQIHPLEPVGRASQLLADALPDEREVAHAFLEVARIRELAGDRMLVHLDAFDREAIEAHPELVFAQADTCGRAGEVPLAALVSPLVLESDGTLVPVRYGFPRSLAIGNMHDDTLAHHAERWRRERLAAFRDVCRTTARKLLSAGEQPFVNWFDAVVREAVAAG